MTVNGTGLALLPEKYHLHVIQIVVVAISHILKGEKQRKVDRLEKLKTT